MEQHGTRLPSFHNRIWPLIGAKVGSAMGVSKEKGEQLDDNVGHGHVVTRYAGGT